MTGKVPDERRDAHRPQKREVAEAVFKSFFDSSPDAIVVVDGTGRIVNVNPQAERAFGYSEAELAGHPVELLLPERYRAAHRSHRETYAAHPSVRSMGKGLELYGRHKDGSEFAVDIMLSPVGASAGGLILSVIRDISEKKLAELELRQLIDAIPQQVFVFGPDWKPLFANKRELEYTGLTQQEAQSRDAVARIFHPEDLNQLAQLRERALEDGAPFEMEARIRAKDGRYRWFLVRDNPMRDERGRIVRWYGTRTDIEDRKRAEERLRQSEEELRRLIDVIPHLVVVFNPDWEPLFANRRTLEYTGLKEMHARDAVDGLYLPEELKEMTRLREEARVSGLPFETEVRLRAKNGAYRRFLIQAIPLRDAQERVVRWYGTGTDIEDRKAAEEAWQDAQRELAHVTRVTTLGELAASIAHEVSQPLTSALGNADLCRLWLERSDPNVPGARDALDRIVKDCRRASEVIHRLRALASKTYEKQPLDVNDAVGDVVEIVRHELARNQVLLELDLATASPVVSADRIQLQQVIINLAINGIESMQPVTDRPRELAIRSGLDGANVVIAVRDSGVGIAEANEDQLFEPFYTTKSSGMGMGLSICRSIVEAHGGRLWCSRNAGPGATFQFTLLPYGDEL